MEFTLKAVLLIPVIAVVFLAACGGPPSEAGYRKDVDAELAKLLSDLQEFSQPGAVTFVSVRVPQEREALMKLLDDVESRAKKIADMDAPPELKNDTARLRNAMDTIATAAPVARDGVEYASEEYFVLGTDGMSDGLRLLQVYFQMRDEE